MGMFIEVQSAEKGCPVIINLDHVIEVAPLSVGGCEIKMSDDGVSRSVIRVENNYSEFKQFVMQTVTSEQIQQRIDSINKAAGRPPREKKVEPATFDIPKLGESKQ